jgi:hypothetical protein
VSLYMTPERYRTIGHGLDLDGMGVEDIELQAVLTQASAIVDSYCNIPMVPSRYSFFGGSIGSLVGGSYDPMSLETHSWDVGTEIITGTRRAYPWHHPIKQVNLFRIYVTNSQYVEIAPDELFINVSERYVEVVALAVTSIGVFGSGLIPNVGLARPVVRLAYDYGYHFVVVGETLYPSDALTYRASNQFWHDPEDGSGPNVYVNGTLQDPATYTYDNTEGVIVFGSPLAAGSTVTCDYHHALPADISTATGNIATNILTEAQLRQRGMAGISRVSIGGDVSIQREDRPQRPPGSGRGFTDRGYVDPLTAIMLEDYVFVTARGGS